MFYRLLNTLISIFITLMLAVLASFVFTTLVCLKNLWYGSYFCNLNNRYFIVALIMLLIVSGNLFYSSWEKSRYHIAKKGKPLPLAPSRLEKVAHTFASTINASARTGHGIYEKTSGESSQVLKDHRLQQEAEQLNLGWFVEFDDGIVYAVTKRDLYHFLERVVSLQRTIETSGNPNRESPLGQRRHSIGRRKLDAYKHLLIKTGQITQVNAKVVKLSTSNNAWWIVEDVCIQWPPSAVW